MVVAHRLFSEESAMAIVADTLDDENGSALGTGNHKGCPYSRFAGACFHSNDREAGAGS